MRDKPSKYEYLAPIIRERAKTMSLIAISKMPDIPCSPSTLSRIAIRNKISIKHKASRKAAKKTAKRRTESAPRADYSVSDLAMMLLTRSWNNQLNLRG